MVVRSGDRPTTCVGKWLLIVIHDDFSVVSYAEASVQGQVNLVALRFHRTIAEDHVKAAGVGAAETKYVA